MEVSVVTNILGEDASFLLYHFSRFQAHCMDRTRPNKQARRNQPPIMLRLIKIQDTRGTMYLVTSVLSVRENALVELEWSLVGLWFIQLLAAKEQIKIGNLPRHSSDALARHAIHEAIRSCSDPAPIKQALKKTLSQAVTDEYKHKSRKSARYKPNYKDQPSRGKPTIRKATKAQRAHFGELAQAA